MRRGAGTFRARIGRRVIDAANAIRKVVISTSIGSDWGILGYEFENPETGTTTCEGEDDEPIPVFQGIGIYARPVGSNAEAVMLHVGNQADHPILTAIRDEDGRKAYVEEFGEISGGEIAIFNGAGNARVLVKADGAIEINPAAGKKIAMRSDGGTADALVKRGEFLLHGHTTAGTGTPSAPVTVAPLPDTGQFPGTTTTEAE